MFWRYCGLFIQFVIVLVVARTADLDVAGHYFSLFGVVTVLYIFSGVGIPDALVRLVPKMRASGQRTRGLCRSSLRDSTSLNGALALLVVGFGFVMTRQTVPAVLLGCWWFCYAEVFLASQFLIAVGEPTLGLFGAYSIINFGYVLTLLPYLVIVERVTLTGMISAAVLGSAISMASVGLVCASVMQRNASVAGLDSGFVEYSSGSVLRDVAPKYSLWMMIRVGSPLSVARFLQGLLPWVPVWVLALVGSPEGAALYSAASRLAVVVTSILGAIRFGSRTDIVVFATRGQWRRVEAMSRRASFVSATGALVGLLVLAFAGRPIVKMLLGDAYLDAAGILMVLMVGILAEAFGGLSDEILKMTGHANVVLITLSIAAGTQALMLVLAPTVNTVQAAWTTVLAFALQYVGQVLWLRLHTEVSLWPLLLGRSESAGSEE
jgi:O-antigen/teichoic acid export membrane protein